MPQTLRDSAIQEFGSIEEWKAHYVEALSSEDVQRQYAKVVEWYGGKDHYMTSVKNPVDKEVLESYQKRIHHILDKLFQKREMEIGSFDIRELIGEYGFVVKQMLQLKDEKGIMLAQAQIYLDDNVKQVTDEKYCDGFSAFLNRAIIAFYER
ncbi:MAG: TipAS antibiotic-recognition domain-containing protein [Faecousia sp.]